MSHLIEPIEQESLLLRVIEYIKSIFIRNLQQWLVFAALIALMIYLSSISPSFLTFGNFLNVTRTVSINGIMAMGMTMVIVMGGIDLSVGSTFAVGGAIAAGFVGAVSTSAPHIGIVLLPTPLAILAGLFAGSLLGYLNGTLITRLRIPPFVVTLGMMSFARGLTYLYTGGYPITFADTTHPFVRLGTGYILGLPIPTIIFFLVIIATNYVMRSSSFGRSIYIIGENATAAHLSGINTQKIRRITYAIMGGLAALSGILLTARVAAASPVAGQGYELDVIAAVVIGGTSLSGGKGSLFGTLIGVFLIGVITNGLNLLGVYPYYQYIAKGLVIVLALALDGLFRNKT